MESGDELDDLIERFSLAVLIGGKVRGRVTLDEVSSAFRSVFGTRELTPQIITLLRKLVHDQGIEWHDEQVPNQTEPSSPIRPSDPTEWGGSPYAALSKSADPSSHHAESLAVRTTGFVRAGAIGSQGLNLYPGDPPQPRTRHKYGHGPFAKLIMPKLPTSPGVYLWELDGEVVYVGQTRTTLSARLGPNGYSTISLYNTFAREAGKRNGGQQTNCRVNAFANEALSEGKSLVIWYKITTSANAKVEEAHWMATFGKPIWNLRLESGQ